MENFNEAFRGQAPEILPRLTSPAGMVLSEGLRVADDHLFAVILLLVSRMATDSRVWGSSPRGRIHFRHLVVPPPFSWASGSRSTFVPRELLMAEPAGMQADSPPPHRRNVASEPMSFSAVVPEGTKPAIPAANRRHRFGQGASFGHDDTNVLTVLPGASSPTVV